MLHDKIDSEKYKAEFIKKLSNFAEKAPILLSFITSDKGVTIIHTNSGKRYEFEWNFEMDIKAFIYNIKQVLVENHYPRLLQQIKHTVAVTAEEHAAMLEQGADPADLPTSKEVIEEKLWRIDRVIVWRDIFILVDEETDEQFRYKMNKSCIFFLKGYRSGQYTLETAAEYFFSNSTLLNAIELEKK